MSRGSSGRVVVEIEPKLKRELYATLAKEGLTLKDWFIASAQKYIASRQQLDLFGADGDERAEGASR